MDERVKAFVDGLVAAATLNPGATRDRTWELFLDVDDERSRVALLAMYDAAMRVAMEHTEADGGDVEGLIGAIAADKCAFAFFEAMDDQERVDADEFQRVVRREVAAGRMGADDPAIFGEAAVTVLRTQRDELRRRCGGSAAH
ncbi:hypothetical protein GCM10011494_02920 [Novosphingobium endophyticum]|uniref:Uncharacterized protein n=1 Tax=Novosphingobium endophyticum TaxID=1955250 RepID=A0A916TP63_9SPHN|nr:hypothetical protein [Novosphingobium endophyticum]GGB87998.1 hypothetical protein GCM10011494_02920 [Novosphingobium endophyticum]